MRGGRMFEAEFRRYLLRFVHLFPEFASMAGIHRTRRHQYDSLVRPLTAWLGEQGVTVHTGCRVTDLGFAPGVRSGTVDAIHLSRHGRAERIAVAPEDLVFVTNGSMTDASSLGTHTSAPPPAPERSDAWLLWHHLPFDAGTRERILATSTAVPCVMPYITGQFLVRRHGDRPEVVPAAALETMRRR